MLAYSSTQHQPAMFAGKDRTHRMPFAMPAMCMASAAATAIIHGTGVITSVSLCVVLLVTVLLLGLIIGLSGLTGLISILPVGLLTGLDPGAAQGD